MLVIHFDCIDRTDGTLVREEHRDTVWQTLNTVLRTLTYTEKIQYLKSFECFFVKQLSGFTQVTVAGELQFNNEGQTFHAKYLVDRTMGGIARSTGIIIGAIGQSFAALQKETAAVEAV